ncbi:MAG: DUF2142 domain-containing protein [Actinomycetota bacterium]|nr:DUF2142 domain-containing protein [Actinomycetota bacterium]
MFSTPPGASPDENNHYVRALAVGRGDLMPTKPPPPLPPDPNIDPRIRWLHLQTRVVSIPARLSPQPFSCWAEPFFVGDCQRPAPASGRLIDIGTYVGRYPPYSYLVPGLLMGVGDDAVGALMWGRVGVALTSLAFLVLALALLYERGRPLALLGLLAAVTPMVVFLMASLSSNGVEVAAAIAFFAALLRLTRAEASSWVWAAAGASGVMLALVRDLGTAWVLTGSALAVTLGSGGPLKRNYVSARAAAVVASAAVAVAIAMSVAWQLTQAAHPRVGLAVLSRIPGQFGHLPDLYRQAVGVFGPLDAPMPAPAYWLSGIVVVGLSLLAFVAGSARHRVALGASIVAVVGLGLVMDAYQSQSGFEAQARHVLPLVVTIPMLAGEIVHRRKERLSHGLRRSLPLFVGSAAAAVHMLGWYTLARRFSVGNDGPLLFFRNPPWTPIGLGWLAWALVVVFAASLLAMWGGIQYWLPKTGGDDEPITKNLTSASAPTR